MTNTRRQPASLFVDRSSKRWIVRDPDGNYWVIPTGEKDAWECREAFTPDAETELEPVPGHYKDLFQLPF